MNKGVKIASEDMPPRKTNYFIKAEPEGGIKRRAVELYKNGDGKLYEEI